MKPKGTTLGGGDNPIGPIFLISPYCIAQVPKKLIKGGKVLFKALLPPLWSRIQLAPRSPFLICRRIRGGGGGYVPVPRYTYTAAAETLVIIGTVRLRGLCWFPPFILYG